LEFQDRCNKFFDSFLGHFSSLMFLACYSLRRTAATPAWYGQAKFQQPLQGFAGFISQVLAWAKPTLSQLQTTEGVQ